MLERNKPFDSRFGFFQRFVRPHAAGPFRKGDEEQDPRDFGKSARITAIWWWFMKISRPSLCIAATLLCTPANAEPAPQVPPPDAVTRVEQGYWNLTRRRNNLPEDSVYAGAQVIQCQPIPGPAYAALLACSIEVSYRIADGKIRHVAKKTNYGAHRDGTWVPVISLTPSQPIPMISIPGQNDGP